MNNAIAQSRPKTITHLVGCLAQGETLEETLQELIVVRNLWWETAKKHRQKLPNIE